MAYSNGRSGLITTAIFLLAVAACAYFNQPFLLALPFILVIFFAAFKYPQQIFYLLLFSIPWSVEYSFSNGFSTDLPDEPLMLLTALISVLLLVQQKQIRPMIIHPLLVIILLQAGWMAITVLLSSHPLLSAKYALAKGWYLLAFVAAPVLLVPNETGVRKSAVILFCSMFLATCLSMLRHAQDGFSFSSINAAVQPFFRNHVNYSALLVLMIPLQIAFLQLANPKYKKLLFASLLVTLAAIYLSYARGAWLSMLTGIASYWLIRRRLLLPAFALVMALLIAAVFWLKTNDRYLDFAHDYKTTIYHETFTEHLTATYQLKDVSTAERFHRWIAGVRMTEDSWQTGVGPNTFYQHYKSYTVPAFKTWVSKNEEQSTVHNYFLLLLIEQGAIGLLLFLLLLGSLFFWAQKIYHRTANQFWKVTAAAVAAILVMHCTLNCLSDLIETDKVGSVFYLCVAMLIIADRQTRAKETMV